MRALRWRLFAAVPLVLPLLACPPGVAVLPKAGPEQVRLLDPDLGEYPEPGYRHIGPVTATRPAGTPRDELLLALRAAGASRGADAVILQRIRTDLEPDEAAPPPQEVVIAEGLAIFWPRR